MVMNYTLMPSLKCRALVKIAANLWNQDDIWASVREFSLPILHKEPKIILSVILSNIDQYIIQTAKEEIGLNEKWLQVENNVIVDATKLPLPESLKGELLSCIRPIGLEILGWKVYCYFVCSIDFNFPSKICWTQHGTVDQKKTAKQFIMDDCLDILTRYQLACVYCLENNIKVLWNQLSEYDKDYYSNLKDPDNSKLHMLVSYWTRAIKIERYKTEGRRLEKFGCEYPLEFCLLKRSAQEGNIAATEYFMRKLAPECKKDSLLVIATEVLRICRWSDFNYNTEMICFLLSQMGEDQIHLFERFPAKVLLSLLSWPYQSFFMETAKHLWMYLHEKDYNNLFQKIVCKVLCGCKDYNYQKLFTNFWFQSPISKVEACCDSSLISILFYAGDKENASLLLRVDKGFIFSPIGKNTCHMLISSGRWDSLRFLVGECISSKHLIVRFRKECEGCETDYFSKSKLAENGDMWEKFLKILNDFSEDFDKKRHTEEKNDSAAKRLCSTEFRKQ